MDHNITEYIISLLDYQTLCTAVQISKQWCNMSKKQLELWHKSDPILPILHNRQIHNNFINDLHYIYKKYLIQTNTNFHDFLDIINISINYSYNDDKFRIIFNKSDKIEQLFEHVIQHLHIINDNGENVSSHRLYIYTSHITLFEKGFVILMYFKSLLNTVHCSGLHKFIYEKNKNYSIRWYSHLFEDNIFDNI